MRLQRVGLCIFAWLQGCSVLVGNSFDDYTRDNARAGAARGGSGTAGVAGSVPEDDADGGVGDEVTLLPPMVPCEGPIVTQFTYDPPVEDLSRWTIRADPVDAMKNLAVENRDGSPKKGALEASMTFTDSRQSFQVVTKLDAVVPTKCISFRLKVVEDPGNPDLSNTKAAWYIFAVDADGCYAQSEIPFSPWWRYDINQAGVWYEASANTPELTTSQMCTHFDPTRVQKVGVGFATSSSLLWRARVVLDTIRVY